MSSEAIFTNKSFQPWRLTEFNMQIDIVISESRLYCPPAMAQVRDDDDNNKDEKVWEFLSNIQNPIHQQQMIFFLNDETFEEQPRT